MAFTIYTPISTPDGMVVRVTQHADVADIPNIAPPVQGQRALEKRQACGSMAAAWQLAEREQLQERTV